MYQQDIKQLSGLTPTATAKPLHRALASGASLPGERTGERQPSAGQNLANSRDRSLRRWSINGDFVSLRPTGVARYAREVTQALDQLIAENHPLTRDLQLDLIAPKPAPDDFPLRSIAVRTVPEFNRPRLPQVWVQMQLPRHVEGGLLSFCNLAPVSVRRQIVCIHDLHTRLMPESYGRLFRWVHRAILPALGRNAACITTVSRFSRAQLIDYDVAPAEKITVTYNGSDHVQRWDAARSSLVNTSGRPYVLCLGQNQKYKNVGLMIGLAPLLDAMGIDLWMAGDIDPKLIAADGQPVPANLTMLGRISDDDFKKALSGALCFLFPSRIEGFGLPAAEAMATGCPVIASTAPCIPEICGDAALYADPDDLTGWADLIRQLHQQPNLRRKMIAAGEIRALSYSWRAIAEIYLKLMLQVDTAGADGSMLQLAEA